MRTYVFLDLDDTLFQTRPKCPDGAPVHPAAYRHDGTPLSFMTERQRTLFRLLAATGTIIPVTARSLDAFRRVDLGFSHLAILDFGGVLLRPDGTPDPAWDAQVRPQAQARAEELRALHQSIQRFIVERGLRAVARVIADFEMPLYVVVKHPEGDLTALRTLRAEHPAFRPCERFFVHCNDNNLSLVPRFLGKERAVQYVLDHHFGPEPVLTLGMGDSLTDAGFLNLCDYSLVPRDCQLYRQLLCPGEEA